MKKVIISSILVIVLSGTSIAQGIYIRAGAGYGLPVATTLIGENYLHTVVYGGNTVTDDYSSEVVSASYGAGANFNFAVGFKFNENLILDFNVQYLAGRKFETSSIYTVEDIGFSGRAEETNSSTLFINPSIIFSAGFGRRAPYGRFGIIAASPIITEDNYFYYDIDGINETDISWKYGGGLAIGFQTAIGMNWKINDRLDIYTETSFVSMTYYAKEANMTEYLSNGMDIMDQLSVWDKQIVYKKKIDPARQYDPDKPQIRLVEATPFSYISAQAGIRFTVWKISE